MAQSHAVATSYGERCDFPLMKPSIIHQLAALPSPRGKKSDSGGPGSRGSGRSLPGGLSGSRGRLWGCGGAGRRPNLTLLAAPPPNCPA